MPVTLIVFPFFTQVIVFFLLFGLADGLENVELDGEALGDGVLLGDGDSLTTGELVRLALCSRLGVDPHRRKDL